MSTTQFDPEVVLADLKDFQRHTAEWVFERMFTDLDPTHRFLVADEVGLGKTHVAKGVIARVLAHLVEIGDERHDIVYVCSNAAIAAQNLRKLLPKGIEPLDSVRRLTMLPLTDLATKPDDGLHVNLLAITPGTSLAFGRSTGEFPERILAYTFLRELWGAPEFPARARWIFWEGVSETTGDQRLQARAREFRRKIRPHLEAFEAELDHIDITRRHHHLPSLWDDFATLRDELAWKRTFPEELKDLRRGLIADVRRALATVGIGLLDPDLVILDEFQRFKDLLDPEAESWAAHLASRLFTHCDPLTGRPTRTLLLSATPYRMYTLDDEDEDHYADFLRTCSFLMEDPDRVEQLSGRFRDLRAALTDPHAIGHAGDLCRDIEGDLCRVMARTERLAATPDRGGMLHEQETSAGIEAIDLESYVRLADIAEHVAHHDPAEYWKSSPYLFNFMEAYKLKQQLEAALEDDILPATERLGPGPGLLDWAAVDAYERIDPQNGRLRWLLDDLDRHLAFDLLWIPASLPYYATGSPYDAASQAGLTKRLVFSGWTVVPKVVSSLVSHEAERRAFARLDTTYTTDYSARGGRRLDFRLEGRRPAAMTAFLFVWPSPTLADLGDPRRRARPGLTLDDLLAEVQADIETAIAPLIRGRTQAGAVDQRWYWAAPLLLDQRTHPAVIDDWFGLNGVETAWADDVGAGFQRHTQLAWDLLNDNTEPLGRVPDDLATVLGELAIGSPAICSLRALAAVTGLPITNPAVLDAAARAAWGFRSLFNAPEVTALVEAHQQLREAPYWRVAVRHAARGNLQAVLDEHSHVLRDWRGFLNLDDDSRRAEAADDIARKLAEALGVRTSSVRVDVPHLSNGTLGLDEQRMRTRFAVAFGNQRLEGGGEARVEAISTAFNSPFWPFVLTSTSVGQEGLDFHLWCHGVVHWNLPANPVDLEQREGRVHRFKGHAVRRNLAADLGSEVLGSAGDPWQAMFDLAADRRRPDDSEMVPYWIYPGPTRILRWAPVPPYSRDAAHLPKLRRSLAAYRLAIGQPRQQELLDYLDTVLTPDELAALADQLRIDLTPGNRGLP
jgi:hypothetical protein